MVPGAGLWGLWWHVGDDGLWWSWLVPYGVYPGWVGPVGGWGGRCGGRWTGSGSVWGHRLCCGSLPGAAGLAGRPLGLETLAAGTATAQQIQEFTAPASARAVLVQNPSETHASHADTGNREKGEGRDTGHGTRDTGDETRPETGRIRIN